MISNSRRSQFAASKKLPSFFIDRSLGRKRVPAALAAAGWSVVTMHDQYGKRTAERLADVVWISEMTTAGHALLTMDTRIFRNQLEASAVVDSSAVVFAIPTGQLTSEQITGRLLANQDAIFVAADANGPAGYAVYETRISHVFPLAV